MSILFMDGADYYTTFAAGMGAAVWNGNSNYAATITQPGGAYSYGRYIELVTGQFISKALGGDYQEIILGFHIAPNSGTLGSGQDLLRLSDTVVGTPQMSMRIESTGVMGVYRGTTSQLGSTSSGLVSASQVYSWVTIRVKIASAANGGLVEVWAGGLGMGITRLLNLTGVNTQATANSFVNQVYFKSPTTSFYRLDNVHICDTAGADLALNSVMDEKQIFAAFPTANGTASQFTANGGATLYGCLDEVPPNGDTDYIDSNASGDRSDFVVTPSTSVFVHKVIKMSAYAARGSAGNARNMKFSYRAGGVYTDSSAITLPTGYALNSTMVVGDMDKDTFNATEFGVLAQT